MGVGFHPFTSLSFRRELTARSSCESILYDVLHLSFVWRLVVVGFVRLLALQGSWDARGRLRGLCLRGLVGFALVLKAVDALVRLSGEGNYFGLVLARSLDKEAQGLVSGLQLGDVRLHSSYSALEGATVVAHQPEEVGRYQRVSHQSDHDEEDVD